ncbi:hypothetical protein ACFV2E_31380 [Streptomyces globisporus]|uniref:hypothetical protein n=1 Tax=Streptomyces globisporus TaxID=1908 RepID=UPI0036BE3CD5
MTAHRRPGIIDLIALLIIVAGPITLVIVGKADAATIVIVGEFIVGVLAVWFYQQRITGRTPPAQPAETPGERRAASSDSASGSDTSEHCPDADHRSAGTDTDLA